MRKWIEKHIENTEDYTSRLLAWGNQFRNFILLNSNISTTEKNLYQSYDLLAACSSVYTMKLRPDECFRALKKFNLKHNDWKFGYLSYDLKNETENLSSNNYDGLKFPAIHFFVPKYVFILHDNLLRIEYLPEFSSAQEVNEIFNEIKLFTRTNSGKANKIVLKQRIKHDKYLKTVELIKKHISKGDIYEMNFCQEFYSRKTEIFPPELYLGLNRLSPSPFSAYMKYGRKYLISSSPERFLAKRGEKIISQPIKGTIRRGQDPDEDLILKAELAKNEKERAENVMIVDLVRNDLSKTAKNGSVNVEELCRIYSYEHVHQMISTITSSFDSERFDIVDVIRNAFPMGSMTGAPKIKAMELIDSYEKTKRGLYSGAIGYIAPNSDFDFNVVIRSILFNSTNKYLSYTVGSAITFQSVPEEEYKECILKAKGLQLLQNDLKRELKIFSKNS